LLRIANICPKAVADISVAVADRVLQPDDTIELLGPPAARVISERDRQLVRMRQRGVTIAAIARRFGISSERVRQTLDRDGW
jgi:DNA-directed RNA polymerase sigma subunit (sigma70/sigma32)